MDVVGTSSSFDFLSHSFFFLTDVLIVVVVGLVLRLVVAVISVGDIPTHVRSYSSCCCSS